MPYQFDTHIHKHVGSMQSVSINTSVYNDRSYDTDLYVSKYGTMQNKILAMRCLSVVTATSG